MNRLTRHIPTLLGTAMFAGLTLVAALFLTGPEQTPQAPAPGAADERVALANDDGRAASDKPAGDKGEPVDFARDVLPILSNHCYHCHGPDQDSPEAKKAGFRMDLRDESVGFGYIVPGKADKSMVIDLVTTAKASRRMPPVDSGKSQLKPEQVEILKRWINQGAEYSVHWSYAPLTKPGLPELPASADRDWARNAIDVFVQAKLLDKGLTPNKPADKRRLARRVYLDLIGLPPTPEAVDAFVNDSSPGAYEKLVDGLLASEHFGEQWARQWLDKARYADSQGFEKDRPRTMWRYRDWVIQALNDDMPFDQFTRDQIAGDLVEDPTLDQLIATGFHRNTMTNTEGGTDDEEFRSAAVIDRVNTTMEVWMGITMACVQCHTHKYDPIQHTEYFGMYAFFNQTADNDRWNDAPFVKAPTDKQQAELDKLEEQVAQAKKALADAGQKPFVQPKDDKKKEGEDKAEAPEPTPEQQRLIDAEKRLKDFNNKVPTALVMEDLPQDKRRETYLFKGGSFLAPDKEGGIIEPHTPEVFNPFPDDAPRNRLGLAQWLTADDNPLTARVQANRVWEQLWGVGLVDTTEDFGFQGSYPSNKQLLDYLAFTYQHDLEWSTKSLIKMIVMSSAYRQSGATSADRLEIDPFNRLMSRGPRLRLSAEQIRDQALAVSGLLVTDRVGGPSVTPYLPKGMLPQAFDGYVQKESKGDDLYRRGVYTMWRRTAHYASFAAFDAPARDICTTMRSRTNTPLQAFVTLNDPVYVEAAQALGRRIIEEAGDDLDARLKHGMHLVLMRDPSPTELETLRAVYSESLEQYENDPEAAEQLATIPRGPLPEGVDPADAAAMTLVGNVLLNLDEVINKP